MRLPLLLLPVLSGCWVLSAEDLEPRDEATTAADDADTDTDTDADTDADSDADADTDADTDTGDTGGPPPIPVPCGDVTFTEVAGALAHSLTPYAQAFAFGRLDGDDLEDIVFAGHDNYLNGSFVAWSYGVGGGTFTGGGSVPIANGPNGVPHLDRVAFGDLDGGGAADDVAVLDVANGTMSILLNQSGDLVLDDTITVSAWPNAFVATPLDGDATSDLAIVTMQGILDLRLQDTPGSFVPAPPIPSGGTLAEVTAADLDGDGDTDLALADHGRGAVRMWLGDGSGGFADGGEVLASGSISQIAAVDTDADGITDLVVSHDGYGATVEVFLGLGGTRFAAGVSSATGREPTDMAAASFLGDFAAPEACASVVTTNTSDLTVSWLRGLGDGTFAGPITLPVPGVMDLDSVVVAQLDAEGTPLDIAVLGVPGTVRVWLGSEP